MADVSEYLFRVIRGNTWPLEFRFKDSDGNVIDLTGYNFIFRGINNRGQEEFRLTTEGSGAELSTGTPTAGILTGEIGYAETRQFPSGRRMRYELEARYPNGWQITWLMGEIETTEEIANDDVA